MGEGEREGRNVLEGEREGRNVFKLLQEGFKMGGRVYA